MNSNLDRREWVEEEEDHDEEQQQNQIDQEYAEAVSEVEAEIRANLQSLTQDYKLEEVFTAFFFVAQEVLDKIGYDVVERKEEAVKDE